MPGARDRQELRNALDDPQHYGLDDVHRGCSSSVGIGRTAQTPHHTEAEEALKIEREAHAVSAGLVA
jgi:hypothetical protein